MTASSNFENIAGESDEFLLTYDTQPPGEKPFDHTPEFESDAIDRYAHDGARPVPVGLLNPSDPTPPRFEAPSWRDRNMDALPMAFSTAPSRPYNIALPPVTALWLQSNTPLVSPAWQLAMSPEHYQAPNGLTPSTFTPASSTSATPYNMNIPDSPMSLVSPSSSVSQSRTPTKSLDMGPPKKKRGRPFKTDLSAVTTRARPGRPPKNPPIDTTSLPSPTATDRRRSSTSTIASASTSQADSAEDRLLRNRRAATKCRAKAQAAAAQLEAEELTARATNRRLSISRLELHNEVLFLRHELLRHVNCDCPLINGYLAGRARMISGQGSGEPEARATTNRD